MPPASSHGVGADAASRVRFRRAVTLLVMTLLLPGSAQLAAGRRGVGRLAVRVALGVLGGLVLLVVFGLVWHGVVYWLVSSTLALTVLRLLLCALAVGWALLFLDAWRLGQPLELRQKQRLAVVALNGVLCFAVAGTLLFASHMVAVQKGFITAMFGNGAVSGAHDGRYNVLLLGGDSGADRWGMRPDSLTVASIDARTGRTVLFGLPRNMTGFPFPHGSVMAGRFPATYDCSTCELNSLATWARDHQSLFKGDPNPGVEATTEGVEGITGLKVNYYAMVNLQGFRDMVQAVGGLTLNVRDRIPIGGVGGPVTGHLEPGVQRLNGFQTLWFARSRESADDYSRMARQKCVMNAMLQQLSPSTVVLKFERIARASEKLVTTDLPASELGRFVELAMKARSQPVRTVSFVPPAISTSHPDVAKIRSMVRSALDRSVGKGPKAPAGAAHRKGFSPARKQTVGGSVGNMQDGYAANASSDLSSAC
ncbi:MAG TPA: LCP family protein [Nocardioidaceae bacterium]|nr:LCP family protein [Nocardioidaceae bacterium]